MNEYQNFIALSRYARWIPEESRRETWPETVQRYLDHFKITDPKIKEAILNLEVMPSMRALMTAGIALERDQMAGYNCSFIAVDHPRVFDEVLYVLMCGTGVGYSVERQFINKLPEVSDYIEETDTVIKVRDSKIGWATAYRELISMLYAGRLPSWDTSKVRPAGARLKTFGGRASGPEPLEDLFRFTIGIFKKAEGRKLTSIECHDILCKVADIVVAGGVRRSALISLSNLSDDRMRSCKSGEWWKDNVQRALANNSACYTEKPDFSSFLKEWASLYESRSGERGIFSRVAAQKQAARSGRRETDHEFGTNPCSEIVLRSAQVCNLSESVVRADDTLETLKEKVRIAAILGTYQATQTNFRYVRPIWRKNTEEEALLGVSLTGIMDHKIMGDHTNPDLAVWLEELRQVAVDTNKEWAEKLGINQSVAITCVKPSGTVSQLVDSASGIHPRFSPYYIRRVRADEKDPLAQFLKEQGVPCEVDVMKDTNLVFSFPTKAPDGSRCVDDIDAMDQLKLWMIYQNHWCEHKPSITVYYDDEQFLEIGAYVYKHFDEISGISFLPKLEHTYRQAPYEAVSEEEYHKLLAQMPAVDWSDLEQYEREDTTAGSKTYACSGGSCEIVDLV